MSDVDENLDAAQSELVEASSELERLEGRKLLLAEKQQNASQQIHSLKKRLKKKKENLQLLENQLKE